jgi:hypothetical protein
MVINPTTFFARSVNTSGINFIRLVSGRRRKNKNGIKHNSALKRNGTPLDKRDTGGGRVGALWYKQRQHC